MLSLGAGTAFAATCDPAPFARFMQVIARPEHAKLWGQWALYDDDAVGRIDCQSVDASPFVEGPTSVRIGSLPTTVAIPNGHVARGATRRIDFGLTPRPAKQLPFANDELTLCARRSVPQSLQLFLQPGIASHRAASSVSGSAIEVSSSKLFSFRTPRSLAGQTASFSGS